MKVGEADQRQEPVCRYLSLCVTEVSGPLFVFPSYYAEELVDNRDNPLAVNRKECQPVDPLGAESLETS